MTNLFDIINNSRYLHFLNPSEIENFPGGGSGGGGEGGGVGGTTSGLIVPGLTIFPSGSQSVAIGTNTCFTASGAISIPSEATQNAVIDVGPIQSSNGTWTKTSGANGPLDVEGLNSKYLHPKQPFQIQGKNSAFVGATPGVPLNNEVIVLGVKSTGGYTFFWMVYKYCNAVAGDCAVRWSAHIFVTYPDGTTVALASGLVEFNQYFRLKSDGNRIIWEYTTEGNWVYNRAYMAIPEDVGKMQFIVNAAYVGNKWTNLQTSRGSYQGIIEPDEFVWSTNCPTNLEISGERACFNSTLPGSCDICVSAPDLDPVCVNVVSSPLYLTPTNTDCGSCGGVVTCLNIPDPTTPVIKGYVVENTITITWSDSISFTTGLHYEMDVNGVITDILDSTTILTGLADGVYTIKVRAVDDCGQSIFSNIEILTVDTSVIRPAGPTSFLLTPSLVKPETYTATWDPVVGSVGYEIWSGNPQTVVITTTTLTSIFLGQLISGLNLSVRSIDGLGEYTSFSNIEIVP